MVEVGELLTQGERKCGKRNPHAPSIDLSCGVTSPRTVGVDTMRCDLLPGHYGYHHACGGTWQGQW